MHAVQACIRQVAYMLIRPHDRVDEVFVIDASELVRVKQTKHDAQFCRARWKLCTHNVTQTTYYNFERIIANMLLSCLAQKYYS